MMTNSTRSRSRSRARALAVLVAWALGVGALAAAMPAQAAPVRSASASTEYLYIADSMNFRLLKISADGTQSQVGTGSPYGVAADSLGNVYYTDQSENTLNVIAPDGTVKVMGSTGKPRGVAAVAGGSVYVTYPETNQVARYTDGAADLLINDLNAPWGVAADADGNAFIADTGSGRVLKLDPSGVQSTVAEGLDRPFGIAVTPDGSIFVSEKDGKRLVKLIPSGQRSTIATFGSLIYGIAVGQNGHVFVSEALSNTVWDVAADGTKKQVGSGLYQPFYVADTPALRAPQFTTDSAPTSGAVGRAYSYLFHATGDPLPRYTVDGTLPKGLGIDAVTGQVSGTPTQTGDFAFTVMATSDAGLDVSRETRLSIAPAVDRAAGSDRFATSAEVSSRAFPKAGDAKIAFLASGMNYADALSAAPAAAKLGGPVLLTAPDALPGSISTELGRLGVTDVVVVGGTAAVSDTVVDQLEHLGYDVKRKSGADRFETSRVVGEYAFGDGADKAIVATGTNYADALASAAAIGKKGPVVLVNGAASEADKPTKQFLNELGVSAITVAGGVNAVSAGLANSLSTVATVKSVDRRAGADRYETANAINKAFFSSADRAFLATGFNFPDALSGGAWAATVSGPLYLVPGTCVTGATLDAIKQVGATPVTLLGGETVLSPAVEKLTRCS